MKQDRRPILHGISKLTVFKAKKHIAKAHAFRHFVLAMLVAWNAKVEASLFTLDTFAIPIPAGRN